MICANCKFEETNDAIFCSSCGQKFGPHKLTLKEFFHDMLDHVLALETNFFRTFKKILIPGQLTLDYFNGLKKRYYHPLRLFFVLMVIHLGSLSGLIPYDELFGTIIESTNKVKIINEFNLKIDSLSNKKNSKINATVRDSIKKWLEFDEYLIRDTIKTRTKKEFTNILGIKLNMDIPENDLVLLPLDTLYKKYEARDYFQRIAISQAKKFLIDPKSVMRFLIGNISWMMLILIPVLAFFVKLLFGRGSRYYIEHLFFLYHWHAAAFLVGTVLIFFGRNYLADWWSIFLVFIIIFGIISWKRYYRQGWIKTIFKFFSMGMMYLSLFAILLCITVIISFGFF